MKSEWLEKSACITYKNQLGHSIYMYITMITKMRCLSNPCVIHVPVEYKWAKIYALLMVIPHSTSTQMSQPLFQQGLLPSLPLKSKFARINNQSEVVQRNGLHAFLWWDNKVVTILSIHAQCHD